jgi:hypothetical protein
MSLFSGFNPMVSSQDSVRAMREDLWAQVAPLDRYGMVEPIERAVAGLRALVRALSHASCQALRHAPGVNARCCGCEG